MESLSKGRDSTWDSMSASGPTACLRRSDVECSGERGGYCFGEGLAFIACRRVAKLLISKGLLFGAIDFGALGWMGGDIVLGVVVGGFCLRLRVRDA